jgi:hypothetical protein
MDRKWLQEFGDGYGNAPEQSALGVAVRKQDGVRYTIEPPTMDPQVLDILRGVNAKVGLTMSSEITETLFAQVSPFQEELQIGPRFKIPVVQSLDVLVDGLIELDPKSYACLLREERIVLLWSDTVEGILTHGADVEDKLMGLVSANHLASGNISADYRKVWGSHIGTPMMTPYSYSWTPPHFQSNEASTPSSVSGQIMDEKHLAIQAAIELEERGDDYFDPNTESATPPPRPFLLMHAGVIGVSVALVVFVEMLCVSKVCYL